MTPGQKAFEGFYDGKPPYPWEKHDAACRAHWEKSAKAARKREPKKPPKPRPVVWWVAVTYRGNREVLEMNSGEDFGQWRSGHKVRQGSDFAYPRRIFKSLPLALRAFVKDESASSRHYDHYVKQHARRAAMGKKLAAYYRKAGK